MFLPRIWMIIIFPTWGKAFYYFSRMYTRMGVIVRLETSRAVIDTVMRGCYVYASCPFMDTRVLTKSDALCTPCPHLPLSPLTSLHRYCTAASLKNHAFLYLYGPVHQNSLPDQAQLGVTSKKSHQSLPAPHMVKTYSN